MRSITVNSLDKCRARCYDDEYGCTAFALRDRRSDNCLFYGYGPYTYGDGRSGYTCYIMQAGTYVLISPIMTESSL